MKLNAHIIAKGLRKIADDLENDNCPVSEEELLEIYENLLDKDINRTVGAKMLHMSVSNFDRLRREDKDFPKPKKRWGDKPVWSLHELQKYAEKKQK